MRPVWPVFSLARAATALCPAVHTFGRSPKPATAWPSVALCTTSGATVHATGRTSLHIAACLTAAAALTAAAVPVSATFVAHAVDPTACPTPDEAAPSAAMPITNAANAIVYALLRHAFALDEEARQAMRRQAADGSEQLPQQCGVEAVRLLPADVLRPRAGI